jgi:CRISPR system Cascade subunit CasE
MPYLSRIWLNPLRIGAQRLIRNPQALHAAVLGGIPGQPVTERVLWRLEPDGTHRLGVLVLSDSAPSWEHLVERAGWSGPDQALVRPYQPLLDAVVRGREFAFRLRANPVSATRHPQSPSPAQTERLARARPRGERVPHRTVEHQLAWLTDRAQGWGFRLPVTADGVPDVRLTARDRVVFTKRDEREAGTQARRVTLQTATYEGRLQVHDPAAARLSLLLGVGPARAYGCGLITLAPLTAGARAR